MCEVLPPSGKIQMVKLLLMLLKMSSKIRLFVQLQKVKKMTNRKYFQQKLEQSRYLEMKKHRLKQRSSIESRAFIQKFNGFS